MGLFFEVLSAINDPKQDASIQQLSEITNSVQSLAQQNGIQPDAMQSVMTNLGPMIGPLMKQQMGGGSGNMVGNLMNMATGSGGGGMGSLASMITPQMMQALSQQSGVGAGKLQSLIPGLLPILMKVMNMGNSSGGGANPILNAFLGGGGGGADLGTMMKFAGRFMNPPR